MTTMLNLLRRSISAQYTNDIFLRTRLFKKTRTSLEGAKFPLTEAVLAETKVHRRCFFLRFIPFMED